MPVGVRIVERQPLTETFRARTTFRALTEPITVVAGTVVVCGFMDEGVEVLSLHGLRVAPELPEFPTKADYRAAVLHLGISEISSYGIAVLNDVCDNSLFCSTGIIRHLRVVTNPRFVFVIACFDHDVPEGVDLVPEHRADLLLRPLAEEAPDDRRRALHLHERAGDLSG